MTDILALDATAQLQAMESGRIGAFELLEACQTALNARNVGVNAVVAADFERAQERARAIDEQRVRGDRLGTLAGLPLTVKDSFDVEGLPAATGASRAPRGKVRDARVVARARSQDAVVWGKTNAALADRAWQTSGGPFGAASNPWDLARTPGGSSGGSAAAVAIGLSSLDIGSDSAGGLRLPASFCGVFSHLPTGGLLDNRGHVPPAPGMASERDMLAPGPVARSARDLRLLMSAMTEAPLPAHAAPFDLATLKVGLWIDEPAFVLDSEVRAAVEAFADQLAVRGAEVRPMSAPAPARPLVALFAQLLGMAEAQDLPLAGYAEAWLARGPAWAMRRLGADPFGWAGAVGARTGSHRAWQAANEARARLRRVVAPAFEGRHALIAPCAPVTAFAHQKAGQPLACSDGRPAPYGALAHWNALASVCGLPATTIPIGLSLSGRPVGVQIIGPRGADSRTLAIAQAIEESLGGFAAPPKPQDI